MSNTDRTRAPEVADFGPLFVPEPQTMVLDNGILLRWIDSGEQPVCRLTLSWASGPAEETARGSSALLAATMSEGTSLRPGAEVSEKLDFNGAWLRIASAFHHTTLSLFSQNSKLSEVLPLVVEIVTTPSFPEKELAAIAHKQAAAIEIAHKKVKTQASAMARILTLGPDHPLTPPDDAEKVRSLTRSDVAERHRAAILAAPPRAYLAGRISPEVLRIVVAELSKLRFHSSTPAEPIVVAANPSAESATLSTTVEGSMQTAIYYSIPSIPRSHPDYERLRMVVMALGGYFGSRLMQNIREEKGYTYGISAGLVGMREGSHVSITTECDNRYAEAVVKEIDNEIRRLANEPMAQEELAIVRRTLMSMLASTLDSPFSIMDYHVNLDTFAMPRDYFARHQQAAASLTPEDVCQIARRYLFDQPRLIGIAKG